MNANWFATHADLLLSFYAGLALVVAAVTLWRARKRRRAPRSLPADLDSSD